jgi:hypothetical protein
MFSVLVGACWIPGTYFDPFDEYVRGLRFFDYGQFERARVRWERLAKEGDCDAQFRLATLYFLGKGVPQSYETTHQWLLRAANQGQAFAQALLAAMYAENSVHGNADGRTVMHFDCSKGCGVKKDMITAYKWMRLSERSAVYKENREGAEKEAAQYGRYLTADQIAEAERQIKSWRPLPAQCHQRRLF